MRHAQIRQTLFLIVLTVVYLGFELGFNARLLDLIGSRASAHDIEELEFFGRSLSGIAAALVVLQLLLARALRKGRRPHYVGVVIACALTGLLVFGVIKTAVNVLVATRDSSFRRVATNAGLLQRALVQGDLNLDGLADDKVYARPEGKAFLALFQVLLPNIDQLDDKVEPIKRQVIRADVLRQMGSFTFDNRVIDMNEPGLRGYHHVYREVMKSVEARWNKYAGLPVASDEGLAREQQRAWNDYRNRLSRRNWTPETVPARYEARVAQDVRKQVPVSAGWHPADRVGFEDAVASRYWKSMRDRGVRVEGDDIPPGLSYHAFIARPGIQRTLRKALQLPDSATVLPGYADEAGFRRLHEAMVDKAVKDALPRFSARDEDFQWGGKHAGIGQDAARAAIVPPVALLCSLLGAVGHFAKLLYLIVKLMVWWRTPADREPSRAATRVAGAALVFTLLCVWSAFSLMQNDITRSDLFQQMAGASGKAGQETPGQAVSRHIRANVAHVVIVGQSYTYPFNEAVRTYVLQGFDYGYHGDAT